MEGRIVKQISNDYTVLANNDLYVCKSRGKFRNMNITPLVGDFVTFDENENYIMDIKPRKSELVRPRIANIDQAMIIASAKEPDFSTNLLDKLLMVVEYNNVLPIIVVTKLDLLNKEELKVIEAYISYYKKIGYKVFRNDEHHQITDEFKDKVTVFTGQSGAGKSTLLNNLEDSLNIKTAAISKALGRGKHTTRHTELLSIFGGLVADTPGFSSINLDEIPNEAIRDNFIEFNEYKDECKYRSCMHNKEDNCNIKNKVLDKTILSSRYENYLKFIEKR